MNVLKSLTKSFLKPLGETVATSVANPEIRKKILESKVTTLINSSKGMGDIMKIVKSLKDSGLLIKDVNKTIKNEAK